MNPEKEREIAKSQFPSSSVKEPVKKQIPKNKPLVKNPMEKESPETDFPRDSPPFPEDRRRR